MRDLAVAAAVTATLLSAAVVYAVDIPVHGRSLSLRVATSDNMRRLARFVLTDEAIQAPLPDPRFGARLLLSGGIRSGQCRVDVELDPTKWSPLSADGARDGYRYLDSAGTVAGIRRIVLAPGKISMLAGLSDWPCALSAATERVPVSIELRAGSDRYCAAFGGAIKRNERRRFFAAGAAAPTACGKTDVTVANLNVLHGLNCNLVETRHCRVNDRSILLFQWVDAVGCPDVLTFQEIFRPWNELIAGYQEIACPFAYGRAFQQTGIGVDDQIILSRFPITEQEVILLYRDFRSITFARIDHAIGPLDVFTTHLASSADGGDSPCEGDCPPACVMAGAVTVRDCQAVQMAQYIEARHDVAGPAIASGDFNAEPGSFVYRQFVDRGWTDVYLAAGNPECDPQTGIGCTSGRDDESLTDLQSRDSKESERIDFIFAIPPSQESSCNPEIETTGDPDGDLTATALFTEVPNPFSEECGAMPLPMCFPSDHVGVQLDWNCAVGSEIDPPR
jgi:endonuclease/exonuclease/phosphatase family metal-dependent hydrolase